MTVSIPNSAMPAGVAIQVVRRPASEVPPELRAAGVSTGFYDLLPNGQTFAEPVRVTQTFSRSTDTSAELIPSEMALRSSDGTWEWAGEQQVSVADSSYAVSGTTTHFSEIFIWSDRTTLTITDPPRRMKVGQSFTITGKLTPLEPRDHPVNFPEEPRVSGSWSALGMTFYPVLTDAHDGFSVEITCQDVGRFEVHITVRLQNMGADTGFFERVFGVSMPSEPLSMEIVLTGNCIGSEGPAPQAACIKVVHKPLGKFPSYLDTYWLWDPEIVTEVTVTILGANDDKPAVGMWNVHAPRPIINVKLGIDEPGDKTISEVLVQYGSDYDVTAAAVQLLGGHYHIDVPYPAQPTFGVCP